jgi:phosphate transport system permease protein
MDRSLRERVITSLIRVSGYSAILFVALIFYFLARSGLPALAEVPLGSLLSARWYPIEDYFGIVPLIGGSLVVTIGALLVAFPLRPATRSAPAIPIGRCWVSLANSFLRLM